MCWRSRTMTRLTASSPRPRLPPNTASALIPGVELTCSVQSGETHLLGYFVSVGDDRSRRRSRSFVAGETRAGRRSSRDLNELGIPVRFERVKEIAGEAAIGRPMSRGR